MDRIQPMNPRARDAQRIILMAFVPSAMFVTGAVRDTKKGTNNEIATRCSVA